MSNEPRKQRDQKLVRRIRAGEREAFETLFRTYADALCTFAAGHVGDRWAEDVVQTVFCELWNRREDWHPHESVKAYLYHAVRNAALDRLSRRDLEREWTEEEKEREQQPPSRTAPAKILQNQELSQAMAEAVNDLPERRRMVYKMAHYHDMTYAEIATALDIAPKTVENQMGRALKTLRDQLKRFTALLQ